MATSVAQLSVFSLSSSTSSSSSSSSSSIRAVSLLHPRAQQQRRQQSLSHGLSLFSGSTSFLRSQSPLSTLRTERRVNLNATSIVRAAFFVELASKIFRFFIGTPIKILTQKLEDNLDLAAKMVISNAKIVKEVAEDVDELAEKVEAFAEKTAAMADRVDDVTEEIHNKIENVLDVVEGEKDFTYDGSTFQIVEKKSTKSSYGDVKETA